MRINNGIHSTVAETSASGKHDKPRLTNERMSASVIRDIVELNPASARELPIGAIEHDEAKRYFNTEINASLEKALEDLAPEVSRAVYHVINRNLFAANQELNDEDRALLLEAGLSQAEYIAQHYIRQDGRAAFMDTMNTVAAIAKTRRVDPDTGQVVYLRLPNKPAGAPDNYVNAEELMRRYDPEAAAKMDAANASGGNGLSMLLQFAHKIPKNPHWVSQYRSEQADLMDELKNASHDNRFGSVRTGGMEEFLQDMKNIANQNDSKVFFDRNLSTFAWILKAPNSG